jgi:hypothetical protein
MRLVVDAIWGEMSFLAPYVCFVFVYVCIYRRRSMVCARLLYLFDKRVEALSTGRLHEPADVITARYVCFECMENMQSFSAFCIPPEHCIT